MKALKTPVIMLGVLLMSIPSFALAQDLVVYSGRSKTLVEPLIKQFEEQTGLDVAVRFGKDAQLLATLAEEGNASPADVFWANTAGALGAATSEGLLAELPDELLSQPAAFTSSTGTWEPVTTRFRVLAYNDEAVDSEGLPGSVMDLPGMSTFRGRIGWTPTYSSFQDFVTAMRLTEGEEATREWLRGMKALDPKVYPSNTPMVQALAAGEIDVALTNHYYVLRVTQADGEAAVAIHTFDPGDVGNLALVTGAGVLKQSDQSENAQRFLAFLLENDAQTYAAANVHEYPVVAGVEMPDHLMPMNEALELSPEFDFAQLQEIEATLQMLREEGLF